MKDMTDEEINQLPTILNILDQIAAEEEGLRNNARWSFLSNLGAEDKFEIFQESPDGPCVLKPTTSCFNSYFRGQTQYFNYCRPVLYRDEKKDKIERFIDRIRSSEFELLLQTHPFVKLVYEQGIGFKNYREDIWIQLNVNYLGLAQHYELETELLDFTSDKWVAAFFATCIKKKGKYLPIDEHEDKVRFGVVYRYTLPPENLLPSNENFNYKNNFSIIGLQPFKRPGEQKGFALQLDEGENLNHIHGIEKYLFRHDKLAAEIIFNRKNQGKDLFPFDELEELTLKIKTSKKISNNAFKLAFDKYPVIQMDEELVRSACIRKGYKFVNYPIVNFAKGIETTFLKNWKKEGENEFFSKIVYKPVYIPPDNTNYPSL